MEVVKFDRIISVNSEIEGHEARNLLDGEIRPNKNWMCEKGTERAVVILQLNKPTILSSIHVGNSSSAFVEILVGRAADANQIFESLLPMSILMKPHECKMGENKNQTRFFCKADFNEATASKHWDRIKVVCTQPFNKYVPYGLCFLKVHGLKESKADLPTRTDEGGDIQVGSFFRKKRQSDKDKPSARPQLVIEQIKQAEKESLLAAQNAISIARLSAKLGDKLKNKTEEKNTDVKSGEKTPKRIRQKTPERKKEGEKSPKKGKTQTPKKHNEEKQPPKGKSPKKDDRASKKRKEIPRTRKKPFEKLMEDVVLVISGFKNPLRGDIRSMALKMGAKYSADWNSHCTHLVCAYENTPKFRQVKGKGKIVKKDWVQKCHKDKKRYPWRRYALDKSDSAKPESEEEICGGDESEPEEVPTSSKAGISRDEMQAGSPQNTSSSDEYNKETDNDDDGGGGGGGGGDDGNKKYDAETNTTDYPMPFLPDILSSKVFFVDPNLKTRKALERYIIAYNGTVTDTFNNSVEFYVTEKGGAPVELLRKKVPNLVAVKPSWIWEVKSKLECVPTAPHLVK